MPIRNASVVWEGDLKKGNGVMKLGSGAFEGKYSYASRFEEGPGTNPEELIGAAHAGCFSMALAGILASDGFAPKKIQTSAKVKIEKIGDGFKITEIELKTEASVPDLDKEGFLKHAQTAKENCPVSQALKAVSIKLQADLVK